MQSNNTLPKFVVSWRSIFIVLLVFVSLLALVLYLNYVVFQTRYAKSFAVDRQGNIYLAEGGKNKIEKYNQNGKLQAQLNLTQKDSSNFYLYTAFSILAIDSQNNFFAINNQNKTIDKYDERGNLLQKINIAGDPTTVPSQLVVDGSGNIYVLFSEGIDGYVRKYTKAGTEVTDFNSTITGWNKLDSITAIAIDTHDNLYLTNLKTDEVYKLETGSSQLTSVKISSSKASPNFTQMVVDDQGNFYFTTYAGSIVKYNRRGAVSAIRAANIAALQFDAATNSIYGLSNNDGQIRWQKFNTQTALVGEQKLGTSDLDRTILFFVQFGLIFFFFSWLPLLVVRRGLVASDYPTTETILPPRLQQMLSDPRTIYDSLNLQFLVIRKPETWAQSVGLAVGIGVGIGIFTTLPVFVAIFIRTSLPDSLGLIILLILFVAAGGFLFGLANWIERLNQTQARQYGGILQEALSTFPNSYYASSEAEHALNEKLRWRYQSIFFGSLAVLGAAGFLVLLNNTTFWLWEVGFISCVGISWLLALLLTNLLAGSHPEQNAAKLTRRELSDLSWRLAQPFLVLLVVTIGLGKLGEYMGTYPNYTSPIIFWILGIITILKYSYALTWLARLCTTWVSVSHNKEDYATAIRKAKFMEQRSVDIAYPSLQVMAHTAQGSLAEGEQQIFTLLVRGSFWKTEHLAVLLEQLVFLRAYAGRYAEAFYLMERSIQLDPNRPLAYANLAEIYLRMTTYPQRAFMLLEHVTTNQGTRLKQPKTTAKDMLINRAWALAQLGQLGEAETVLQNALSNTEKESKSWLSSMYFRAARIKELQNQPQAAVQYYQQILQISPTSHYGQWARQLIEQHQQKQLS